MSSVAVSGAAARHSTADVPVLNEGSVGAQQFCLERSAKSLARRRPFCWASSGTEDQL